MSFENRNVAFLKPQYPAPFRICLLRSLAAGHSQNPTVHMSVLPVMNYTLLRLSPDVDTRHMFPGCRADFLLAFSVAPTF
jgi:hypothetical protein